MPKSDLPFGSEFSPELIDLPELLRNVERIGGDRDKLENWISRRYFRDRDPGAIQDLAKNPVLALASYGLINATDDVALSPIGEELLGLADDEEAFYERFARHILLELHGLDFIEAIIDLESAGKPVTLLAIAKELEGRDLYVPASGTHMSRMRAWLSKAGIFPDRRGAYEVQQDRVKEILGIGLDEIEMLEELTREQRAYLRALARIPDPDPLDSAGVRDLAEHAFDVEYNPKSLPKDILQPLEQLGYIMTRKVTDLQGAKPTEIYRTDKFSADILEPVLEAVSGRTHLPRRYLKMSLADILKEMEDEDKNRRGRALEALAIYLVRLVGLEVTGERIINLTTTGGLEVDVIAEGYKPTFVRWQIQCKHTPNVSLRAGVIAKEVGLANLQKSQVLLIVTSGKISRSAYQFAKQIMRETNLVIMLIKGSDLRRLSKDPTKIIEILDRETKTVRKIKSQE